MVSTRMHSKPICLFLHLHMALNIALVFLIIMLLLEDPLMTVNFSDETFLLILCKLFQSVSLFHSSFIRETSTDIVSPQIPSFVKTGCSDVNSPDPYPESEKIVMAFCWLLLRGLLFEVRGLLLVCCFLPKL